MNAFLAELFVLTLQFQLITYLLFIFFFFFSPQKHKKVNVAPADKLSQHNSNLHKKGNKGLIKNTNTNTVANPFLNPSTFVVELTRKFSVYASRTVV